MYNKNLRGRTGLASEFEDGVKTFIEWAKAGLGYFSSSHDGVPEDGTRSCPIDVDPSLYCYGGSPYNYESGLADRFYNVVHAADQPLWNSCTHSQLALVAELVDIKKDDVDLEYCKFCGDARYKLTRGRDPRRKKSPYVALRYLPLIPHLQRLYCSTPTAERMTCHATPQTEEGSMCHPSDAEAWKNFYPMLNLRKSYVMFGWTFAEMILGHIHMGVRMYDHAMDNAFIMRAALIWTVNDLPPMGWRLDGVPPRDRHMEASSGLFGVTEIPSSDSTRLVLGLEEPWQSHAHDGCSLDLANNVCVERYRRYKPYLV
ncbi:hypothetical protein Sango_1062400 [Sesamum angolense]|uniref:Uncharacterized protein n=1 Tax=Sesamum angolense TaxID=2727404 RepID=A0AAE2BZ82_9LAMI|nr:hypothetical protein Sango_1062400 [Sesamum angolense]